jgi:transposase
MYLEGKKSQSVIAQELGLPNKKRVKIWVRQYREEGEEAFLKLKGRPRKVDDEKAYIARLEMENELLRNFHCELSRCIAEESDIG